MGRVFDSSRGRVGLCRTILVITETAQLKVENSAQTTFRLRRVPGFH
jgi:hypothetical protein